MRTEYVFSAIAAEQGSSGKVFSFSAKAQDLMAIATIDRIGRDEAGSLKGFQRPQIASHIREISDYLKQPSALLPNPIVVAFTGHIEVREVDGKYVSLTVDTANGPPGLVVDGQQRLTALSSVERPEFEVFVSALLCESETELKKQFVLINNTRPLPKSLIYELLPSVSGLPGRFESRTLAASITERLNFEEDSSLKGQIYQHTNPSGVIRDTAMQRVIMNSLSDGALRELAHERGDHSESAYRLICNYYAAVQRVFRDEWVHHTPKSSRLVHGAGIVAMGYVMELLFTREGARTQEAFEVGLAPLVGCTAWSGGAWQFSENDIRPWNSIQNINREIVQLADYLIRALKREARKKRKKASKNVVPISNGSQGVKRA